MYVSIDDAIVHLVSHAHNKTLNRCAEYVANALEAGGFNFKRQASAYMYYTEGILIDIGYKEIPKPSVFEKGDISVTENCTGHRHGHIAMWSGNQWISDFKQKNKEGIVYSPSPPIHYFRYEVQASNETHDYLCGMNHESTDFKDCKNRKFDEIKEFVPKYCCYAELEGNYKTCLPLSENHYKNKNDFKKLFKRETNLTVYKLDCNFNYLNLSLLNLLLIFL